MHNLFPCYPVTDDSLVKDNIYIGAPRLALNHARNPNIPFDPTSLFQEWHKKDLISYFSNCYVLEFSRRNKKLIVTAVFNDKEQLFRFDRLYLGAGCINTTSVVDRSLFGNGTRTYQIKTAPIMLSLYLHLPIGRLKRKNIYTEPSLSSKSLSEVFVEHRSHATNGLWSHTQINSFNSTILSVIQKSFPLIISKSLLIFQKFLKFSITVFHSSIGITPTLVSSIALSDLYTKQQFVIILEPDNPSKSYLGNSLRFAIIRKFFLLGLVPLPFGQLIADVMRRNRLGGWHYGGTLPMTDNPSNPAHLKTNGELHGMKGVYIMHIELPTTH